MEMLKEFERIRYQEKKIENQKLKIEKEKAELQKHEAKLLELQGSLMGNIMKKRKLSYDEFANALSRLTVSSEDEDSEEAEETTNEDEGIPATSIPKEDI